MTALCVTAYSLCTGMGRSTADTLAALRQGRRGLSPCPFSVPFQTICGVVPDVLEVALASRTLRLALLGVEEIREAVDRALTRHGRERVALLLGTSTGGIFETERAYFAWRQHGALPADYDYHAQHPFHRVAYDLAQRLDIRGPVYVVSTACSSSAKVFASARRLLDAGAIDAAVVGGCDSLCHTTMRGFHSLGVMAETPCRPFSEERPGMNVGEAAAFLLLERTGDARALMVGVGESSDAFHMSAPDPEGRGAALAMLRALEDAGVAAAEVDYINAHGTGTKRNDEAESTAIHHVFGEQVPVASTKGYTGHTLGAAGAVEAIFAIAALEEQRVPESIGAAPIDPAVRVCISSKSESRPLRYVLSNSLAFGGNNVSLLFSKC